MTFTEERVSFNLAWIKKAGEHFEVVIDPDAAIAFREARTGNIHDIVKSAHIFKDAKKGLLANEHHMKESFGTSEPYAVAEYLIRHGEIQLTQEHRDKLREQKRNKIISTIQRNAMDPRTKLPHPRQRIELAFDEAKIKIDEIKSAEDQVQEIVKKLQPILPIRFEHTMLQIHVPAQHAPKLYPTIQSFGEIKKQEWLHDGSWLGSVEIPAGMLTECVDTLNSRTHGSVQIIHS